MSAKTGSSWWPFSSSLSSSSSSDGAVQATPAAARAMIAAAVPAPPQQAHAETAAAVISSGSLQQAALAAEVQAVNEHIQTWATSDEHVAALRRMNRVALITSVVNGVIGIAKQLSLIGDAHAVHDSALASGRCEECAKLAAAIGALHYEAPILRLKWNSARLAADYEVGSRRGSVALLQAHGAEAALLSGRAVTMAAVCRSIAARFGDDLAARDDIAECTDRINAFVRFLRRFSFSAPDHKSQRPAGADDAVPGETKQRKKNPKSKRAPAPAT